MKKRHDKSCDAQHLLYPWENSISTKSKENSRHVRFSKTTRAMSKHFPFLRSWLCVSFLKRCYFFPSTELFRKQIPRDIWKICVIEKFDSAKFERAYDSMIELEKLRRASRSFPYQSLIVVSRARLSFPFRHRKVHEEGACSFRTKCSATRTSLVNVLNCKSIKKEFFSLGNHMTIAISAKNPIIPELSIKMRENNFFSIFQNYNWTFNSICDRIENIEPIETGYSFFQPLCISIVLFFFPPSVGNSAQSTWIINFLSFCLLSSNK